MLQTNVAQKIKTHILCQKPFFSPKIHIFYVIMWKNNVEPAGPQMSIWRMLIARWVPKATHTQ